MPTRRSNAYGHDPQTRSSNRAYQAGSATDRDRFRDTRDAANSRSARRSTRGREEEYYEQPISRRQSRPVDGYHRSSSSAHRARGGQRSTDQPSYKGQRAYEKSRGHDRRSQMSPSEGAHRFTQVATAAVVSGLTEAVRSRHSPEQSKRAVRAAVGAAAVNALVGSDRNGKGGSGFTKSAVGGMLINRLVGGQTKY